MDDAEQADKSDFTFIGHARQQNSLNELKDIEVIQKIIGRATKTKYLGFNIDENLSWKDQYKKIMAKVDGALST